MSVMDHWHPVYPAARLGRKPVGICLNGEEIVLFRGAGGQIGALSDTCPHRRMRLSLGSIVDGRLQCTYHGWTYDCQGHGESPGTPKLRTRAAGYEATQRDGHVWIKSRDSDAQMPPFDVDGYMYVATLEHRMRAPLELVLDNFTEVEHTPTTHALLGYDLDRMHEVVTEVHPTDTSVRVYNAGPQKRISPLIQLVFNIRVGDTFVDDWTTYFSPVYTCYDQYWIDVASGGNRGVRWRIYVFFNPIREDETQLVTFAYAKSPFREPLNSLLMFRPLLWRLVDREVRLDIRMVESLADKRPAIDGMKLSRFDRVLGLNRERIERIYRGRDQAVPAGV